MSTLKKLLGQRIREFRKNRGITQEKLAELLGIGTANISYIENGKFAPSIENFEKLITIFNVEPYELYKFPNAKTAEEIKSELFCALSDNEELLRLIYEFYKSVRCFFRI